MLLIELILMSQTREISLSHGRLLKAKRLSLPLWWKAAFLAIGNGELSGPLEGIRGNWAWGIPYTAGVSLD
jgi:hypothetical protein